MKQTEKEWRDWLRQMEQILALNWMNRAALSCWRNFAALPIWLNR